MKISIAMATYNGSTYLTEQLQSFVDQTRQPDELVITDDGSTDDTMDIIEEFAKVAPFEVRYSRNKRNLGYAGNFNAALTQATGDLVFLSDQDDVWFREKIETMIGVAEKHGDKYVFMCDAELTDCNLLPSGLTKIKQIQSAGVSLDNFFMGCCVTVRKSFLEMILPLPAEYPAHDAWIVRLANGVEGRQIVTKTLQFYRRHETNHSTIVMNRLEKATRFTLLWEVAKRLSKCIMVGGHESIAEQIKNNTLLLAGVQRACRRSKLSGEKWISMENTLRDDIRMLEKRLYVHTFLRRKRVFKVWRLWTQGVYPRFPDLRHLLMDLLSAPK